MAVRSTYFIDDVQKCIHACLAAITSDPWTRWDIILGWPEADAATGKFVKPPIYIMPPKVIDWLWKQGGKPGKALRMIFGAWDDRGSGGAEEINIIDSRILDLFTDPAVLNAQTFTVTLGSTITGTTLIAQGIGIEGIIGPHDLSTGTGSLKEFRHEFDLDIII
jgi:hypothetical protein